MQNRFYYLTVLFYTAMGAAIVVQLFLYEVWVDGFASTLQEGTLKFTSRNSDFALCFIILFLVEVVYFQVSHLDRARLAVSSLHAKLS